MIINVVKFKLKNYLSLILALFFNTAFSQTAEEYSTKTAFMVKMTHFISWPDNSSYHQNNTHFTICLEGPQNYFTSLKDWAITGHIKKKPVVLKYIHNKFAKLTNCNILYITNKLNLDRFLKIANERKILTVSDITGSAHRGVLINFLNLKNNIKFEINLDAAKRIGFNINPRLLKLATIIRTGDKK